MDDNDYVLAFDHFYTTNHIQILKSLLPFIENGGGNMLPAVIKYMELKYTLSVINSGGRRFSQGINACSAPDGSNADISGNLEQIYNAVRRYLAPAEEKSFNQILSAMRAMKNVREMQQMVELFQSMNPDLNMDFGSMSDGIDINEMMQLFNSMKQT